MINRRLRSFISVFALQALAMSILLPVAGQNRALPSTSPVARGAGGAGSAPAGAPQDRQERAKELNRQAIALQSEGKLTEACALYRQAIAFYRRTLADADWLADELRPRLDALLT